jgi:hypothetical protein
MSESDFFYPTILYKHNCYLHAGASWNRHAFEEILGNGLLDDHTLLRPSLKFFLFSQPGNNEEERLREIVLDLLTTPTNGTVCSTFGDVARVESFLWTLLASSQYSCDVIVPFKKDEIVECLKTFRSILTIAGWKANTATQHRQEISLNSNFRGTKSQLDLSNHSQTSTENTIGISKVKETEELLQIFHLLSILCRSLVLAWNSYEKTHVHSVPTPLSSSSSSPLPNDSMEVITLDSLLSCLTPGSASDLANMILEGVKLCHQQIWQKKYESFHIRHGFHALNEEDSLLQLTSQSMDEETSSQLNSPTSQSRNLLKKRFLKAGKYFRTIDRKRYLAVREIELPLRSIFQQICKHIPNYSLDILHKIFEHTTTQQQTSPANGTPRLVAGTAPASNSSSNSWSLWRR